MGHQYDADSDMMQDRFARPREDDLLDSMGVSVSRHLLDEDLSILWANCIFYGASGYTREEYQAKFPGLRQYYGNYAEDFKIIKNKLVKARQQGQTSVKLTCRMPGKDGSLSWVCMAATFIDETLDGCGAFNTVIMDVDDLALQKEEKKQYFTWMLEEYTGNIYISDMDTYELLYLNKESCATLQGTKEDFCGKKCYEVIQGRTSPCPFCNNARLTREEIYEWEFYNSVLKRTFIIRNRIIDWNGRRARIELSHDMYSAEYKLALKDREREALINTIPGGLVRIDARDYNTVLWYAADFLDMLGYTKEQFENEAHSQCLAYLHPEDMKLVSDTMKKIEKTGETAVLEMRFITRAGKEKILMATFSYVSAKNSFDGVPSFYSMGIDITETRREESRQRKALEDAYKSLRAANSAKTDFLSAMSHDIRTPMNAIVGMTAIAQANLSSAEKVKDCLKKINISSCHLLSLINEVLDMSKIESGKIDLVFEDVELSDLVQSVSDICRPLMVDKGQEFKIIVGQVWHEKIVTDRNRLQQVFLNLLSNAMKYTPAGGKISMTLNELPSLIKEKGWYEFVFTDNGIGMSSDFIPKIFEPFTRAEDSCVSKIQGTGLGLAITENIVQMMNGTIKVESELGVGSRFTVLLPLQLQDEEESLDEELIGLPVLVVDDDQLVCENAALLLAELGMRGYWVLSGEEAVRRIAEAHNRADDFFAVILDWKMPGMDGLETLKFIRKNLSIHVPIIIISAYDYSDIEEEFVCAGADAFITKPLFKSKMRYVLQLFCSKKHIEEASARVEAAQPQLSGKRILLAEDNEINREIVVELLQMQGVVVDTAENGAQAVSHFQAAEPGYYAVILMDIQMPVMDGYAAAAAIRSLPRDDARDIPILALTANAFVSDVGKVQSVGMNAHVAKPVDPEHLCAALQKWIR